MYNTVGYRMTKLRTWIINFMYIHCYKKPQNVSPSDVRICINI